MRIRNLQNLLTFKINNKYLIRDKKYLLREKPTLIKNRSAQQQKLKVPKIKHGLLYIYDT